MATLCLTTALVLPCRAAPPDETPAGRASANLDASASASPDPATLVAGLERDAPARTAYTELRFSRMLDRPLILRGELEYLGPGKLGKRVDTPYHEQTTVADGEAIVQRGKRAPRHISLRQAPELDGFLRGFAALLGGDAQTLAQDFTLSASGDESAWQLRMVPRDRQLARRIEAIEVDGAGTSARCFRTSEADGDVSVLLVEDLAGVTLPARPLPAAIATLCRGGKAAQ
ncbi:MAG TPA: LolA-related protein [Rhodanobacteraceae bacterium]|nr:LolA-related protein [Rhodanobacteraceae bacterium]